MYVDLHSAYRRFDPVRGMDYQIHLNWFDSNTNGRILKSYEIVKPLGHVEIVQSPYVTESTRISLILPVFEGQVDDSTDFMIRYNNTCMSNKDNTLLMLVSHIFCTCMHFFHNFLLSNYNRLSCIILILRTKAKKTFLLD